MIINPGKHVHYPDSKIVPGDRSESAIEQVNNKVEELDGRRELPDLTELDEGKVLTASENNTWEAEDVPEELPHITSDDDRKVVQVLNGEYTLSELDPDIAEITELVERAENVQESIPEDYSTLSNEVADLKSDLSNVLEPPANLVKLSMVEENKTVSTTGIGRTVGTTSSSSYDLAVQIPVIANVSYESYNARLWLVTDDNGVILEVNDTDRQRQSFTITPAHSGLLYVVFYNSQRERYYVNTNGENKYISPTVYPPQEWLLDVLDDYTSDTFERVDTMIRDSYNLVKANQY